MCRLYLSFWLETLLAYLQNFVQFGYNRRGHSVHGFSCCIAVVVVEIALFRLSDIDYWLNRHASYSSFCLNVVQSDRLMPSSQREKPLPSPLASRNSTGRIPGCLPPPYPHPQSLVAVTVPCPSLPTQFRRGTRLTGVETVRYLTVISG